MLALTLLTLAAQTGTPAPQAVAPAKTPGIEAATQLGPAPAAGAAPVRRPAPETTLAPPTAAQPRVARPALAHRDVVRTQLPPAPAPAMSPQVPGVAALPATTTFGAPDPTLAPTEHVPVMPPPSGARFEPRAMSADLAPDARLWLVPFALLALFGIVWWRAQRREATDVLQVLQRVTIGKGRQLLVVAVDEKPLVMAVTEAGVKVIARPTKSVSLTPAAGSKAPVTGGPTTPTGASASWFDNLMASITGKSASFPDMLQEAVKDPVCSEGDALRQKIAALREQRSEA